MVFFVRMMLDTCVTVVNYPGRPHMESLMEHKKLLLSVGIYFGGMVVLLFNLMPELNQMLGFVELTNMHRGQVIAVGLGDFLACFLIE